MNGLEYMKGMRVGIPLQSRKDSKKTLCTRDSYNLRR